MKNNFIPSEFIIPFIIFIWFKFFLFIINKFWITFFNLVLVKHNVHFWFLLINFSFWKFIQICRCIIIEFFSSCSLGFRLISFIRVKIFKIPKSIWTTTTTLSVISWWLWLSCFRPTIDRVCRIILFCKSWGLNFGTLSREGEISGSSRRSFLSKRTWRRFIII